jgi:cob(I)alamin adenosyltransferase
MSHIYLICGDGGGKTTTALGLALRALGHNQKVLVIQFLKWNRDTGEYLFKHPNYEIHQFSSTEWIGVATLTEKDAEACMNGLATAYHKCKNSDIKLLILDEINYALSVGMLEIKDVIECIQNLRENCPELNIIMTGRNPPKKLIKIADIVNKVNSLKSSKNGFICEEGIQY